MPREHAVAINAVARDAIQPFCDVQPLDLDRRSAATSWLQLHASVAKHVLRIFVAVAANVEVNLLSGQPRLVEGNDPIAVGPPTCFVHGLELDQRHAAARLFVHHRES